MNQWGWPLSTMMNFTSIDLLCWMWSFEWNIYYANRFPSQISIITRYFLWSKSLWRSFWFAIERLGVGNAVINIELTSRIWYCLVFYCSHRRRLVLVWTLMWPLRVLHCLIDRPQSVHLLKSSHRILAMVYQNIS